MPPSPLDIPSFASIQLTLLSSELATERTETSLLLSQTAPSVIARAGLALLNLSIASQRTGLGGKTVIDLELDSSVKSGSGELPEHGIRTGDIVAVAEQPRGNERKNEKIELEKRSVEGVMVKVMRATVSVALDREGEDVDKLEGKKVWLVKLANEVTYKRMNQTMTRLRELKDSEYTPLLRALFGQASVTPVSKDLNDPELGLDKIEWVDPTLNDSQKKAVKFAIASREVALIHGPPGTGKTHTLIELILQLLKRNLRLLVCGPSNMSVDNIVERLSPHKVPIIRVGHPARLLPSVLNHSLDVLTRTSEAAGIVQDIRKEMDDKQASIRKTRSGRERRAIYLELKDLRKEYKERERKCVDNLVQGSKVVLATLHGAGGWNVKNEQFDVVIIDEASQALEAQCWIPLLTAKKVVLAGDHLQLPPTIKSLNMKVDPKKAVGTHGPNGKPAWETDAPKADALKGMSLETTLFDRLLKLHGPKIKRMLTTQYRMHERIMRFPAEELYESKLIAAESVRTRLLNDLPYGVADTEDTHEPLVFWDTQGGDFPEKIEDEDAVTKAGLFGESKSNEGEAQLVRLHVAALVDAGVRTEDIGIITPYNGQVSILSQMLKERYPGLELGSVDGFQGREKEAVIVSLVRSGSDVGFLAEKRRLNVSMTRPRRHLCVIGDSSTLSRGTSYLKRWMEHLEEYADLRYPNLHDIQQQAD